MGEAVLKIKTDQLMDVIKTLSPADKGQVLRYLEEATWGKRFDGLIKRLKGKTKKITLKEIEHEVEEVRKELYENRPGH